MTIFSKRKEELNLLRKTQDTLDTTNQLLSSLVERKSLGEQGYSDEEKKRAAYALNLCMVSVSQICDYDDIYILEQEYDTILNNLNLEYMPKDEALLDILRQLLNTITFFRIQETEKAFIEREYEYKMKNAIWSAVPNISILVAGKQNPISIALNLASQVGIGYMNYKRVKAETRLENERTHLKLQQAAMEQFNALRRELFTTAWRLADTYRFEDKLRLTERQITQYNSILLEADDLRRYERLDAIKDDFAAYPPFWYHLGHAANMVYQNYESQDTNNPFWVNAQKHFDQYTQLANQNLLREDQLLASCLLEQFDLMCSGSGNSEKGYYLEKALKATKALDVKQLCAFYYMRLEQTPQAAELLRCLVNEHYNESMNAQLLSNLYVVQYIEERDPKKKSDIKSNYTTLQDRVSAKVLYPLPQDNEIHKDKEAARAKMSKEFVSNQAKILHDKYTRVLNCLKERYLHQDGHLYLLPPAQSKTSIAYFSFNEKYDVYKKEILKAFENGRYYSKLYECEVGMQIVSVLDALYKAIKEWPLSSFEDVTKFYEGIRTVADAGMENLGQLQIRIDNHNFEKFHLCELIEIIEKFEETISSTLLGLEKSINDQTAQIEQTNNIVEVVEAESLLLGFCDKHQFPYPTEKYEFVNTYASEKESFVEVLNLGTWKEEQDAQQEKKDQALTLLSAYKASFDNTTEKSNDKFNIYINTENDASFKMYADDYPKLLLSEKALAIFDLKSGKDLIFTTDGICVRKGKKNLSDLTRYSNIDIKKKGFVINGSIYKNKYIDDDEFCKLINNLANNSKGIQSTTNH